ncbi:hypothetical protein [Pararhizobium sp.]|uniref:hypothetical protein n=1 Tax=Pararhizobium sp. TaxID=1977563 RepID=UPI0027200205|nr:hypothetical protein [Pararhizobium sp.]MDO9418345.1 hypothetical protein [Pararhizobium sp.]
MDEALVLVSRIIAVSESTQREAVRTTDPGESALFDLDALLSGGANLAFEQLSSSQLDRLRRKIEVARKLHRAYERDLSRPATATPLSAGGVNQLCAVMLLSALRCQDPRFLNAALKLIDGLILPAAVPVSAELISLAQSTLNILVPSERCL